MSLLVFFKGLLRTTVQDASDTRNHFFHTNVFFFQLSFVNIIRIIPSIDF